MKTKLILALAMSFSCMFLRAIAQEGFTNKAEAKNAIVNNMKEGKWIEYEDEMAGITADTNEAVDYILTVYINDKPAGIARQYDMNGLLQSETPYANGEKNGIKKDYYNGRLYSETPYTNDMENGTKKEYYKDGKLKSETTFTNGHIGVTKNYDENGNEIK
jgi:antitoxin component YwqK of YwqJK toxin-antitoxin module